MGKRKLNFNGGPAAMPQEVLQLASEAVVEYQNGGLSILEIPHRGKEFQAILDESKHLVRELCVIGDEYEVLWLQGGGRLQFCMIPMNFLSEGATAGYVDSGRWSNEALSSAAYYGNVQILSTSRDSNYDRLPDWPKEIPTQLSYVHFTTNNTIYGTQWDKIPPCRVPLIADMSSDIFSMRRDYNHCALFYAAAQKNIGPAGATLVVVHRDFAKQIKKGLPPMLDYNAQIKEGSVLNTSPVFAIYCSLLMLRWTKKMGLAHIESTNRLKAKMLYEEIDRNRLFNPVVKVKKDESLMNVCFSADTVSREESFLQFCEERNITGLKGHRSVGGFRASLYNAVSLEAVEGLVEAMRDFENQ